MKILKVSSIILITAFVSVSLLLFLIPRPDLLTGYSFSTAVYDNQDHLLRLTLSHDDKYRLFSPLKDIAPQLVSATLLQEDRYFYNHPGVNPLSIIKAGWETYGLKSRRQGASTITMQLARIRFGIHSKTINGKLMQIFRAIQLERYYTKDQILEAYLNLAPYGNNIEGAAAASLIFFSKPVKSLALSDALTLAVIPQNPAKRRPDNQALQRIRNKLYQRWVVLHPADLDQQELMQLPVAMQTIGSLPFVAPHFVNSVLSERLASAHQIHTTLDRSLQRIIERISRNYLARKKNQAVFNSAVLLVDSRDYSIKALSGSADFFNRSIQGQINGTEIKRSPGSTLKPFIYALALDQGLIHPETVLKDVPHRFGHYNPENFDYDFVGPVKARDALVLSRNIPAIDLASRLKNPDLYRFLELAQVSQLRPASYYGLALSLGGAELTMKELLGLYMTLANNGVWHRLRSSTADLLDKGNPILSPEASFLVLDMLKNTPPPQGHQLLQSTTVSWKTGTSSGYRDAWSVGVFGPYVMAVWVGNFNNQSNAAFVGKNIAAPLFFELTEAIRQEKGPLQSVQRRPETMNLTRVPVCKASGMLPGKYCKEKVLSWFIPGKSPIQTDTIHREIAIDPKTGLRTCHIDSTTTFEIFEFWPSDLLTIFRRAGIVPKSPPAFETGCNPGIHFGLSPQMTSPRADYTYVLKINSPGKEADIPLTTVTDAGVKRVYWFINDSYLGESAPDKPLLWNAHAGHFVVRVVDDHGRADSREFRVMLV